MVVRVLNGEKIFMGVRVPESSKRYNICTGYPTREENRLNKFYLIRLVYLTQLGFLCLGWIGYTDLSRPINTLKIYYKSFIFFLLSILNSSIRIIENF